MKLSEIKTGESAIITKVHGTGKFRRRIIEMGFVRGQKVEVLIGAPLKDPIKYKVMDYEVSLRRNEAEFIEVVSITEKDSAIKSDNFGTIEYDPIDIAKKKGNTINIALVGNPNSGKTSLFNIASGKHEHVGNYTGVTVDAKEGNIDYKGYHLNIFDLPGTYSLTAYSPEEVYVRKHIMEEDPDIIINVVSASNLERNLYLTTQLIDMDIPMVIALNMYDELEKSGASLDHKELSNMLGISIIPTQAKDGMTENSGITTLLDAVISTYEGTNPITKHIHINHGGDLQIAINRINKLIKKSTDYKNHFSSRFFAVKFLENDKEAEDFIKTLNNADEILEYKNKVVPHIEEELGEDCESAIINAKYGFISGALNETYTEPKRKNSGLTNILDPIVTNKFLGYPIFILFMWLMFECTFVLGAYPQEWLETGVELLNNYLSGILPAGPMTDLLLDGIISGVGGVLVFLPNILILYFFISLMEDSGYLSRAAFIMDKIMHKMGLHGKSFVPMLMGFGCNVPAIMATRTLESKHSRLITMLVIPFMSCTARLPVYVLFSKIFFPEHASIVMLSLYVLGILVAVISARIFKRFMIKGDDTPFVMELPPYRVPTLKSAIHHMWEKSVQYLKKMGTLILFASIIIWALGYFPMSKDENVTASEQLEQSYIGRIGKFIEPVIEPLGYNWKMGIGIVAGLPAKELVVSTLSVLYTDSEEEPTEENNALISAMKNDFTPATALSYLVFILLCFPCIATIMAIKSESGSWKWALFSALYTTSVAWIIAFVIYQIGGLFL
ncbi:MAG: ferrous iron transport protein B [Paludibacteraceae bacterium]|nr:ferrous iron transport protein B [Paludibacteraceae bacterium]